MPDFKTSDGVRLHYDDEGAGQVILCLPGLTRNGSDFDYVAPYLSEFRVIRLHPRGRGKSDWADPETYQIPVEARDVMELLAHLKLEQVAIIGTSRGGLLAMALAATVKAKLCGVCLVDIGPVIEEAGLEKIRGYIGKDPMAATFDEAATARARIFTDFKNVPEERWLEEAERAYTQTDEGLKIFYDPNLAEVFSDANAVPAPDLWPLFDALADLPLALIRGANSTLLSMDTVHEMQRRRPDMIFANVPDRGHVPFLDEAEALDVLNDWCAELP